MGNVVENENQGKQVAEVTVGSVTVPIFFAPTRIKVSKPTSDPAKAGNGPDEYKTYDSFVITYYEGSVQQTRRRNTLEKAKIFAKEIAERINKEGAKAVFFTEKDRRIFILAKSAAEKVEMEVDEVCRKFVELQRSLTAGTLDQAVSFYNDHGQRVKHGVANTEIFAHYLDHLAQRGAGNYHVRDVRRFVGPFITAFPGSISPITTADIDTYLKNLKKTKEKARKKENKARTYNNVRDAIIAYYNFAQEKGYLPQGVPHAASLTTEFGDARKLIASEQDALELLAPNDIYSPEEMRKLLAIAKKHYPDLVPSIEIKAFSGVRTEEMVRLWWVLVCEDEEIIRIPDAVSKVDARRVPILPNLQRRMAAHPETIKRGRVAAHWTIANSLYHAWQKVCKKAGVPYRRNAFRNSYFSYRLAIVGDPETVAAEGGTSVEMLKKNYLSRAAISRAMAEEWFSL